MNAPSSSWKNKYLFRAEALDWPTAQSPNDEYEINNTFKLLEEGEKKIELSEQHKNVTLVIGNTGDGKSTFIQWIAGDDGKLVSEEVGEDTSKFIIEDGNNRIGSSSNSKTIFPELVVHKTANEAFYDCPGFGDSRSTSYDIASSYFIKKITDHANHVKIVLVTDYPSVSQGVDRQGFVKLLRHTTTLIKDVGKFENSIAMVVTKVDNNYIKKGRQLTLVSDVNIIRSIADFLQAIKKDLHDNLKLKDVGNKEKLFIRDAMRLVDILVAKNNNVYTRIGIFRRPDESGPLSKITLLQEGKENIEQILFNEISFTKKNHNDFGYSISDKSKYDVNILVEKINEKVWLDVSEITEKVQEHYRNLVEEISTRINSFDNAIVCVTEKDAQVLSTMFNTGYEVASSLWAESKNLTSVAELAKITKSRITRLGISNCEDNLRGISEQGKFLSFLQLLSDKNLNVRPWSDLFQKIQVYISYSKTNLKENVKRTANEIKNKIKTRTKEMANEIKAHYLKKIESLEFKLVLTGLNKGFHIMSNLTQELNHLRSAETMSEKIRESIINYDFADSSTFGMDVSIIFYHGKYLKFLKIFNDGALDDWSSEWIAPFNDTKQFLYESEKWYLFLEDLYAKLSEYDIQRDTSKYNVENINDWGVQGKLQGIKITKDNFQLFLKKMIPLDLKELSLVKNIEVTSSRLQTLNDILRYTLSHKIETDCSFGKLVVKGNFIRLSDFTDVNGKILDLCGKGEKSVNVFALNTIFIDNDLREKGSKLQISIIAPKWQIQGSRIIDLDGTSGVAYSKAEDGLNPGDHGSDGKPGQPGGAAGNFLGIGKFINGKNLTITANGGVGGPGQQGGDGARGNDGASAIRKSDGSGFIRTDKLFLIAYNSVIYKYKFYGEIGSVGGNGGQGGIGGKAGMKGEIKILNLDNNLGSPSTYNIPGFAGKDGKGGIGGVGGFKGPDLLAKWCLRLIFHVPVQGEWCEEDYIHSDMQEASGANGTIGGNSQGWKLPEQSQEFQNVAQTVNNYKLYLQKKLQDNYFKKTSLMQFVSQLESNMDIKTYDTLGLANELLDLEEQFPIYRTTLDFMPFYQSLSSRTHEYAQHSRNLSNSYKKATSFMIAATLSRISTLKGSEGNLMTDLEYYLTMVKDNIHSLAILQAKSTRINVINQYKQSHKIYVDKKVKETKNFIKNQITLEIDNIKNQVEDKIDLLVNETMKLQNQATKERLVLTELQEALTASWVLGTLEMVGQVVRCFANLGITVTSAVDSTTQVPQSLSLGSTQLPDDAASTIKSIKKELVVLKDQKFTQLKTMLENVSAKVNKYPEKLKDTSEKVQNLVASCQAAQNSSDFNKMKELEQELKLELTRKASLLKNHTSEIGSATLVIEKLYQAVQFGADGFNIYSKFSNDERKKEVINEAFKQAEDKIQLLDQYETKIHQKLTLLIRNMENDINNFASQLNKQSQVGLDITRWQVKGFLMDIKLMMRQFTNEYAVEESWSRCIEKLEEAMTTLINIYDHIEHYQEQNQLAVYIEDITFPKANDTSITNKELGNAVNKLEMIIMSNLVLNQYKSAVNALTQQVFPFAHHYLAEIPSHLQFDFYDLANIAVTQVRLMQAKLTEYKIAIRYPDTHINKGWFNRDYSTQPFFVWENNKYHDVISKLLSGEKVVVNANIHDSAFDKDAIKFQEIGISFYSENSTVISEVRNKLKGFKVSATHMGNSYYKYSDNIYVITGDSQNIIFSFEKHAHGEPVHKNSVYDKIKSGDLMLSPYAMWEFQLINATNKINNLTMYKDQINLELVGYGSYVARGANVTPINIENYYHSVEKISLSDLCDGEQIR